MRRLRDVTGVTGELDGMPEGGRMFGGGAARNVLGGALAECSRAPITGWFRDGCCRTDENDHGSHTVCAVVTPAFLAFSQAAGNDLSTPRPEHRFPGLQPGDRWCLCALRWEEARRAGCAPPVVLEATNLAALRFCDIDALRAHAAAP